MKPRRSIISVPGHIEKMHHKAAQSNADVIMLDMEDSVPVNSKEIARKTVIESLKNIDWKDKTVTVRINGLDTAYAYLDLLHVAEESGEILDSIVIPKVEHPGDIHFASRMLDGIELNRGFGRQIRIEASVETARGMERAAEIAGSSERIVTLVFGIADYSASIGARLISISGHGEKEEEIYPGHRWHFALSRMVMAAKSCGLLAIDAPFGNYSDPEGLRKSAVMAGALGLDGKWAIHPSQIDIINEVFTPSMEEIERALKIIKAHGEAEFSGRGAIAVEGRMVDRATLRMAMNLREQAEFLKLI